MNLLMFKMYYLIFLMAIYSTMIMLITMSSNYTLMMSPMNLLISLIMLTLTTTLYMNNLFYSWIPMIMFIIIIGGLMIIFMYITSIANNELFFISLNNLIIIFFKIMMMMFLMFMFMKINFLTFNYLWMNNSSLLSLLHNMKFKTINLNNMIFMMMYSKSYNSVTLFIINYLYIALICVMNICYKFKIPLRQINFK